MTTVEHTTQLPLVASVAGKSAEAVTKASIELLQLYKDLAHTITAYNGKEFANLEQITEAQNAKIYFTHHYHSWERGLNENSNGLLRQYWRKQTGLKWVSSRKVQKVIESAQRTTQEAP